MSIANKAYSRRQLITVAEVASALAKGRDRTGLEAVMELAQAVQDGNLTADLYPPHQRWVNDGKADRIGVPASNPTEIWRSLSKKSSERGISDKDDFNYPPAASTWHLLADDVFAFANSGALSNSAAAALRELAVRYKAEAATDAEFLRAWGIHEQVDRCKADIQRWERLEQNAPTPSEAIAAEGKLAGLRAELAGLLSQLSGAAQEHPQATVSQPQAAPDLTSASTEQNESVQTMQRTRTKETLEDFLMPYLVKVFRSGTYRSGKEFHRALVSKAGADDSPFKAGTGLTNALYVTERGQTLADSTLNRLMRRVRQEAAR